MKTILSAHHWELFFTSLQQFSLNFIVYHFPRWFEQFNPQVVPTREAVEWPVKDGSLPTSDKRLRSDYERFSLRCGDTACEFKIRCYRFKGLKKEKVGGAGGGGKGGGVEEVVVAGARGGKESGVEERGGGVGVAEVGGAVGSDVGGLEVVVKGGKVAGAETIGMGLIKVENDGDKEGLLSSPV